MVIDHNNPEIDAFSIYREIKGKRISVIESKVYYEAYFHILKQLQKIKRLPFHEMIVGADPYAVAIPDYCINRETKRKVEEKVKEYTLDQTQSKAFRSAFENNICIIQGPPGTGKTYIGEKIV